MRDGNLLNSATNTWRTTPEPMHQGRWYPTNTTLLNGNVLVTAGLLDECSNVHNNTPDIWQNGYWHRLTGATRYVPMYPWMFAAQNGQVFYAGPNVDTGYLNTTGNGSWTATGTSMMGRRRGDDTAGTQYGRREEGTAVMYKPGKIIIIGGAGNHGGAGTLWATKTTELIDLNSDNTSVQFRWGPDMAFDRRHLNATLLPDGSVLVTGGTLNGFNNSDAYAVLPAELWTPPTADYPDGRWTTLAAMQTPRLYHSTAVLLPDGRVLAAGGGLGGGPGGNFTDHPDAEIFSPPYLFSLTSTRPVITSAPAAVSYNQAFAVQTPDAAAVTRATLVRLTSVTHSFDMNQRFLELSFTTTGANTLSLMAPPNADCPPGQYLLSLLNASGVPSVSKVITVDVNTCPTEETFGKSIIAQGKCYKTVRVRADGANLGTARWFVNGALQSGSSGPGGQIFVDITLLHASSTAGYELEVTPPCGGAPMRVGGTISEFVGSCTTDFPGR